MANEEILVTVDRQWLISAAPAGMPRIRTEMVTTLAKIYGPGPVDRALVESAELCRFWRRRSRPDVAAAITGCLAISGRQCLGTSSTISCSRRVYGRHWNGPHWR